MTAIHQHGTIWKDTGDGIWTAFVDVLGKKMLAHAIEVVGDGDEQAATTDEGRSILAMLPPQLGRVPHKTIKLDDLTCVILILS